MKFHQIVLIFAIIWYAVTAYFSSGYYHFDEHYQIIEFAGILDSSNEAEDLAWEYNAQIRPALQPTICHVIFKACDSLSITDPYKKAFILRLLTGLMSVLAIYFFSNSCRKWVSNKNWKVFVVLSYFIWFLPFINVRFSSETWSGIAFVLALSLLIRNNRSYRTYTMVASLIGLSFLFRYQIAFAGIGIVLWLLFIRKEMISKIIAFITSGLLIVAVGALIDSWFYGNWTFTLWNYFEINLVEGKASQFGTAPWSYYFSQVYRHSFFPIGILIITFYFINVLNKPKNIIIWASLPFLIAHSYVSHKELRFIFPLVNLIPILIILAMQTAPLVSLLNPIKKLIKGILLLVLIVNMIGVFFASLKPVGVGRAKIMHEVSEISKGDPINVFFTNNDNPFSPWHLTTNFYTRQNMTFKKIDLSKQNNLIIDHDENNVFVVNMKDSKNKEIQDFINKTGMKEECKSVPEFIMPILKFYGYDDRNIQLLYQ